MWEYTDQVMDFFYNPRNQGKITESNSGEKVVTGEVGSIACGDALSLHLKVDQATERIIDARFQTFGCASAIASSSVLTEIIKGKTLDEAVQITNKDIADSLGGLPEEKMHCSVMGQEALEAAIANYRGVPIVVHDDDDGSIVCTCFATSEPKIKRVIRENNLTTAEQVTYYVKAGGGCGACLANIDEILAEINTEQKVAQRQVAVQTASTALKSQAGTSNLTNLQKISLIQQIIHDEVRPVVAEDGGDVELYDVEGDLVKVQLKGSCTSCPSSSATLKIAIEATLRDRVLPSLVVEAV
ncbi:MAG: Fe-S cluster assembly protein NifU [Symploca sp. SIO3C6]|uniref:Nitrogen fixation protein NifU n=1 Tax=Symploca sp. SIO1C4 TaxID=2607765 RepID=A0A6B3NG47_9CYAN|nr:Fe-S cluster assembly protein NifU [Symploca sp. SIO3C6]NER29522.1 Fe-S cluster assembly protein NifU [Symploca sp. SIO1C4]NET05819.1 Fe-S cluster assembly protein NifU [Symploca sp. SIO2B6]